MAPTNHVRTFGTREILVGALYGILGGAHHTELRALSDRLAHRGREAAEWSPGRDIHLGIRGPRRIVDVQEHGPVAFEGAIDNRDEIVRLLRRRAGEPVGPAHDAWLVFELIDSLGPEALDRLAGPFAVACWHGPERRLLLARDRVGCAPLYFTFIGDRFAFASEYKALLVLDGALAAPDLDALQMIQATGWVRAGHSCVRGIFPVAPGSYLETRAGRSWSRRYGSVRHPGAAAAPPLGDSLIGALERQVTGYGRIGIALNRGRHSALLARAVRAVAGGREIHTVTAGHGPDDPELLEAARMARAFGARHHPVALRPEDLETLLPWMVWHLEEPGGGEEIAYLFAAAREAAHHVTVILSGFGLDSLLAGRAGRRLADLARRYPLLRTPVSELYEYAYGGVPPASLGGRALAAAYYRRRDFPPARVRGAAALPRSTGSVPGVEGRPPEYAVERLYAGTGLRLGAPGTDPAFLETVLSNPGLPIALARRGGERLAHELRMSDALDRLAVELLSPGAVRDRGFFEPAYVAALLRRAMGQPYGEGRSRRIWSLLLTEIWARTFLDGRGSRPEQPLPPLRSLEDAAARGEPAASTAP
ncbi:MAG: asparagine synthase-related protein [Gemmatimonadales bacterium]